jgi:hypothetical protein
MEVANDRSPGLAPRAKNYAHLLLGLKGRMSHCHEIYNVGRMDRTRTIEADYQLSHELISALRANLGQGEARSGFTVCFPLLFLRKGRLPGHLAVTWQGRRLAITPYSDVHRLQLVTLGSLFRATYGPAMPQSLFDRAIDAIAWMGSPDVSVRLDPRSERAKLRKQQAVEHREATADLIRALRRKRKPRAIPKHLRNSLMDISHLENFVDVCSLAYPVCVELPAEAISDTLSLTIEADVPRLEIVEGFRDRLRMWLEIEPFKFRAPLTRMFVSKSYHLTFKGHESQHLYSQHLVEPVELSGSMSRMQRVNLGDIQMPAGVPGRHLRLESWNQRPVGRFYARGFRATDVRPLYGQVRFHERPPGATATTASMSLLNLFLIGVFGYFASIGEFPSSLSFTSFLLALPALALSVIGRARSLEAGSFISLKARLGEILAMLISLAAVVLYASEQSHVLGLPGGRLSIFGIAVPYDFAWLGLLVISLVSSLILVHAAAVRMVDYQQRLASRLSDQDQEVIFGRPGHEL